ncbi:UGSC family (seleno)protein [Amycolatopsis pigmentata]|uniref:UGSC-like domain-containing protein n=1 Tax=Amycolatopsis pigmentata TaxID=450801 RepID=A0ABW5FR52_9PSEU
MNTYPLFDPTRAPTTAAGAQVARPLAALAGKRIALVKNAWPSWHSMADRLTALLAGKYPEITFEHYVVPNGSAAAPELLRRIADETDAAVVGLANCGSCTAWSFHDAMELAGSGVPVVLVVTKEFSELTDAVAKAKKCDLPRVILPTNPETVELPVALGLIDDAVDEIIARLTEPADISAAAEPATETARFAEVEASGDPDDDTAHDFFYRKGWTDGLPVRLPTVARVERLLGALGDVDPDEVVASMPPTGFGVTYETLAVNAVMAGATPELMPLLVGAVRAACEPGFNLNGIATTTGPSTPLVIVNGPAARETGMNAGRGALGHGWRANAALGRTLRLLINNVGGAVPGSVSKSIMGQPGRFSFCFAENEAESPWAPLHADRGEDPASSAVTVLGATGSMNLLTPRQDVDAMLTLLGDGLAFMGNPNVVMGRGTVAVLITPGHARAMAGAGLSKADVAAEIWKRATVPVARFPRAALPDPPYELVEHDGLAYVVKDPSQVFVVVVGGPEPTHATLVPSHPSSIPVTRPVM